MPELASAIVHHPERLEEIAGVLAKYGFAAWVQRGSGLLGARVMKDLVERRTAPEILAMTTGERLREALTELGTTWIKFGQMMSLRPDVVGSEVAAELTKLQATVPADPPGVAQAMVERELGAPVSELFASFEPEPMASGSVAQVHRATLHDGAVVAVKVLHDGAEHRVHQDLELITAVATYLESEDPDLAQLRPVTIVAEFSQMMHDAMDLSRELENLQRFRQNFARETDIIFPTPYPELSRRRVLTMSLLSGASFTDRASVETAGWNVDALVRRAADVYLEMIFRDSFFHADVHPGNILIPDGSHIALLDAGDVGRISGMRKRQLEDLVIAAGSHDVEACVDVIVEITSPPPTVDISRLQSEIDLWLNRHLLAQIGHLDMTAIIQTGLQLLHDNGLVLPADLAVLFRVLLELQGLARAVDAEVRVTELVEPYVRHLLAQRFDPRRLARHAGRTIHEWDRLIASLPDDIEATMRQIRAGQLGVDFRIHDPDGTVDHLVDGLVAAASVLGSAQLISRRTAPAIGPISLPGLVAAGVGVLTWQRLVRNRREHKTWVSRAREVTERRRQDTEP
ncbi:MAG: AarF/UbiB family protein [Acidimicrobiales bacterium]|jgi:ubiquinone biosynthesis protein